jgi:hypothetical protein
MSICARLRMALAHRAETRRGQPQLKDQIARIEDALLPDISRRRESSP